MTKKKVENKKLKKPNIPLRRKLSFIYSKLITVIKCLTIFIIIAFCFTDSFKNLKKLGYKSIYSVTARFGFIVKKVLVEGQSNLSNTVITTCLDADENAPIFAIDLERTKQCLKANHWVYEAIVQRRLPDTLYIALKERVPIAIWQSGGELFVIDKNGYKITKDINKFTSLIRVIGVDANIYAQNLIMDLNQYPNIAKFLNSATRFGQRRWNLNLKQNITVKMPERNFKLALSYIDDLYKVDKLFDQNYKIIDLRSPEKYYIEKF